MFSILWIAGNGSEMVYPAREISFTPADEAVSKTATISFYSGDVHCSIDSGRVFVMNEQGATVRRYILKGDAEFPHGQESMPRAA